MLDIKFIRDNKDLIKEAARKKHIDFNVDDLISIDDKRREKLVGIETKRAKQNEYSEKITKASADERAGLIEEMKVVKEALQKEEEELREIMHAWQVYMVQVPNVPDISVPEGSSDAENVEGAHLGRKAKI